MAGPHIVGVVALLWSANPKLIGDIDRTEQILRETAQPADTASEKIVCGDPNATPNDFVGYGIVDAYAAVKRRWRRNNCIVCVGFFYQGGIETINAAHHKS